MSKILHILNGDAMLPQFQQLNIKDDVIVWRESHAVGAISTTPWTESALQARQLFIESFYNASAKDYVEDFVQPVKQAFEQYKYEKVYCWFGRDYFCRINFLTALTWLKKFNPKAQVLDMSAGLEGMIYEPTQLNSKAFKMLYKQQKIVNKKEIAVLLDFYQWIAEPVKNQMMSNFELFRYDLPDDYQETAVQFMEVFASKAGKESPFHKNKVHKNDALKPQEIIKKHPEYGFTSEIWQKLIRNEEVNITNSSKCYYNPNTMIFTRR